MAAQKLPPIVQIGRTVLRTPAAPVPAAELGSKELASLVSTMIEVMRAAPGVGLAAPQIGVPLQVIVLEDRVELMARLSPEGCTAREREPFELRTIVNPVIERRGGGRAAFFEGCLSVTGYMALVERDLELDVSGVDPSGAPVRWAARGWPARILQHEIDHLCGTLYVDRMLTRSFCANQEAAAWIDRPVDEVRTVLGI